MLGKMLVISSKMWNMQSGFKEGDDLWEGLMNTPALMLNVYHCVGEFLGLWLNMHEFYEVPDNLHLRQIGIFMLSNVNEQKMSVLTNHKGNKKKN